MKFYTLNYEYCDVSAGRNFVRHELHFPHVQYIQVLSHTEDIDMEDYD